MNLKYENTYEEAFKGFQEKGLYLDTPRENFHFKEKSDCHCLKHPDNKMKYSWANVRLGRFVCKECKKESGVKRVEYTIEEKKKILEDNGFTYVSGNIKNIQGSMVLRCRNGHEFSRPFNNILRGNTKCPICNGEKPSGYWTNERLQEYLDDNMPGYTLIESNKDRVHIQCPNKNHSSYWTSRGHLLNEKTGCKMCYYEREGKKDWTLDNAREYLKEHGYEMLDESEYKSSHSSVYCKDDLGFIYQIRIHFLLRGRRSFQLFRSNKYAIHNIKNFLKLYRPDYELISTEYTRLDDTYIWRYLGDGLPDGVDREFEKQANYIIRAFCKHPQLVTSQFELQCKFILDKYNIEYEQQKTFDECKDKAKLRFDYYVVLNGKEYCIETDGLQHYFPYERYGGFKGLEDIQRKDKIKDKYCLDNNIELIRISWNQYRSMEKILIQRLGLDKIDNKECA